MAYLYSVRDWDELYETAETRKRKHLAWVPAPNKHDGNGFRRLMQLDDPGNLFAAFRLIVEVASKMEQRGVLQDRDGPLNAEDLQFMTGLDAEHFERAFQVLTDPQLRIMWLVRTNLPEHQEKAAASADTPAESGSICRSNRIEENRIEKKRRGDERAPAREAPPEPVAETTAPPPPPAHSEQEEPAETTTAPQQPDPPMLSTLVRQFRTQCRWTGRLDPVYRHFREALQYYDDGQLSQAISKASPGDKPWAVVDSLHARDGPEQPVSWEAKRKAELDAHYDRLLEERRKR